MATSRVCVLIADLPVVASALRQTLPLDHVEVLEAHTFDEATQLAERRHPLFARRCRSASASRDDAEGASQRRTA